MPAKDVLQRKNPQLTIITGEYFFFLALNALLQTVSSDSSGNFPGAEATGAGVDVGRFSVDYRLDALNIGLVSTVRASVGMGNLDAETDFLSAKITFCH